MLRAELGLVVGIGLISLVLGHGYMIEPASRNSAWREGFDNPTHYTDNEGDLTSSGAKTEGSVGCAGIRIT